MRKSNVGIEVCPGSSTHNVSGVDLFDDAIAVAEISNNLSTDELLIDPHIDNPCVIRYTVFGENLRFNLIAPIDFNDAVIVGKDKQELVVKII